MPVHVILMGPQGSGKGTQAERVRPRLNLAPIATGELFRAAIRHETALGKQIKAIYDQGQLVPDDLTVALVDERLDEIAQGQDGTGPTAGALYDGFPRTRAQAEALDRALARRGESVNVVVAIDVPRERLVERLAGRRVCAKCGRVYNVISDPPAVAGVCDACGGDVMQRADDTADAVAKRLDLYDVETAPLLELYRDRGLLVRVNGDLPIDEVTDEIIAAIQQKTARAGASGR